MTTSNPYYEWRGMMLDVVRHFFSVEDVISVMDIAQAQGLNRFHLHLTDDQGWRIDIPGWPQLVGKSSDGGVEGAAGGYYSQADWERLRQAAHERGLLLIPEVDFPGHSNAALHAVPGLNPDGKCPEPYRGIEVGFSSLRMSAPDTERFLRDVYTYIAQISDGYVHIGGDESHSTSHDEYVELVSIAAATVREAGAKLIAWQEAADLLEPGDLVQLWDSRMSHESVVSAAQRGVKVIMSPSNYFYLDMKYDQDTPFGLDWSGYVPLRRTTSVRPDELLEGLGRERIVGIEANIWTETLSTFDQLSYMLLPRLAAVGEIGLHGGVDWEDFESRLPEMTQEWDRNGWSWHNSDDV